MACSFVMPVCASKAFTSCGLPFSRTEKSDAWSPCTGRPFLWVTETSTCTRRVVARNMGAGAEFCGDAVVCFAACPGAAADIAPRCSGGEAASLLAQLSQFEAIETGKCFKFNEGY